MLQQTQAARVVPAFEAFTARFPSVSALAGAPLPAVLRAWGSLGYPRRAVNLKRAAQLVVDEHGGAIPASLEALVRLPGVGPYTAAAVAALGHGIPVAAVDTNVARVVARASLGIEADRAGRADVAAASARWLDRQHPGEWNQALMDLGREICRPKPRCDGCPLSPSCRYRSTPPGHPRRARRAAPFRGSAREARGAVLRALRATDPLSPRALMGATGLEPEQLRTALRSLRDDGLVEASPAGLTGDPRGRVRLAR
jgi:A/G-specific adenine glycosylase